MSRDVDLLFEPLAFSLLFDEACIIQNAGRVSGQCVQDLAVQLGERSRAARIHVQNAKERAAFDVEHGLLGVGARQGVERNDHHGAQALRHDALRRLQIHVGLREIFRNHRRLLFQRQVDGGLAGLEALRWEPQLPAAPREMDLQLSCGIGFEQHAAVGVRQRDGLVQHIGKHLVERQLRVQQRGHFQELVEFVQSAAHGIGSGEVLDAREQLRKSVGLRAARGVKNDFVGILEAKADDLTAL